MLLTFQQALEDTAACRRYVLLGNGFGISLFPSAFSYRSLFDSAVDNGLITAHPPLMEAFAALGTTDFEVVMEALKATVKLVAVYGATPEMTALMSSHAEVLKDVLVKAIAGNHPKRPGKISEAQYASCRRFLAHFIGADRRKCEGRVFTLNYDLLLYWSVLHDQFEFNWTTGEFSTVQEAELIHGDGFRLPEDDYDSPFVVWDQFKAVRSQTVTFLHGGLHLYEQGADLAKLCWERSGNKPLMDQIRVALDDNKYPLFVSEGTSRSKMRRINRSAYLSKAIRSFDGCCDTKGAALFVIGHSLADSDAHIIRRIANGKIATLYVSIFGDPNSDANKLIMNRAQAIASKRSYHPLAISYIDASTLEIWN